MLSARGHRRDDTPPTRYPLCSRRGHSALKCLKFQIIRSEKKPNRYQRDGEHGGNGRGGSNGGGSRNGGGGGNGRGGESGGVGGNRGGSKQKKSSTYSESGDKTASLECYLCLERNAQTALPLQRRRPLPTPNHGRFSGSVRTSLGAGLLAATRARPALAARGAPYEKHEDGY